MFKVNANFNELSGNYLFAEISRKINDFKNSNPAADIIRMGIGDVTLPLAPAVIKAMHRATDEMALAKTFRGYGPEQGYEFLIDKIIEHDYARRGIQIESDEVFISDGSKCDVANIQELFDLDNVVAIGDPVYPVYRDSNILAGRRRNLIYLNCVAENNFAPALPERKADLIYLCSPNNPTGTVMGYDELKKFVDYARQNKSIILFDSAYESYIQNQSIPHSIYEVDGAKEVAIEFRSFSKTAGFTGTRCAYAVIPKALPENLNQHWRRRQTTKFNGVSYVIQRGAEAVFSADGQREIAGQIAYYMENARLIKDGLRQMGYTTFGGENAPYIWWRIPENVPSMEFFDKLLTHCQVVGTPGVGFGSCGEGYFRLTAFGDRNRTIEALERIEKWKIS
ncbi:MAG: LL-diaminopimelate aminotransferase [Lentisphaeria bacterium]|nr:LL-diaminopimelate aminotransferase [Lentisphaeria bacterium]